MKTPSNRDFMINNKYRYRGGERVQNEFQMRAKDWMLEKLLALVPFVLLFIVAGLIEYLNFMFSDEFEFNYLSFYGLVALGVVLSFLYGKKLSNVYAQEAERQNNKMLEDEYVRGARIISADEFNKEQKRAADAAVIPMRDKDMIFDIIDQEDGKRKVMKLPLGVSFQMVGFFGGTGVGKSNVMMQYFTNVNGYKRVVVDIDGSYYKKFYKKGDIVFCPFVKDSVKWNIFSDIKTQFDPANIAKSLVPEDPNAGQNRFFDDGARVVVEAVLTFLAKQNDSTNKNFWEYITDFELIKEIKELDPDVRRTLSFFTNEKQKLTADLLSTIISKTAVRSIEHLKRVDTKLKAKSKKMMMLSDSENNDDIKVEEPTENFSFREWLKDKEQQNTVYLLVDQDIQEMVLPIYRVIIEIMATEILSNSKQEKSPVFMFLDEFPAMGKMEKIQALLVRARKNLGAIIHGAQDYAQYVDIYGENIAKTMINNTNTIFVLKHNDGEYFSKRFSTQDVWEYSESTPMRTTDFNEGITGNKQKKTKDLLLPSEFARLENHEAYVKSLAPDITKVKFVYTVPEDVNDFTLDTNILLR
ncbi:MAG: type IV secretion system DNA-binding domain-containing protein [Aliarcobacter skirrowii]|uniref:type IV secretory system conjugative DNA transfer family protein n=1 Tax=Aliarcobacter skirrowii TaxID=28200 RepID=UPI00242D9039|nr:type IV secretion system DNA-binding domain-containing protein [Aliarcobacter skirrowii]MDD3497626.1 type IV secretion system DNA-binding domain-containing protein [Aliarcobacter skirrowii]